MNVKVSVYRGDGGKNITMVETLIIKTKNWRRNRRGHRQKKKGGCEEQDGSKEKKKHFYDFIF